jgi:hypothetical protein
MSKKLGRPTTPAGKAKTVLLAALFDRNEAAKINAQIVESGLDKSKWLRKVALNAARPVWILCEKWGAADLDRKTVEFKFTVEGTRDYVSGLGRFFVIPHRDGFRIAIEIHGPPLDCYRLTLNQQMADSIAKHDDLSVAEFRCFATASF